MYHPTGRVLTVLELLQSRPGITGPELAVKLETDVRTVRRYVSKLQDVGIPVEANPGRYGGYRLRPGYKLPPLIFSEDEATAMVLGLLGSSWLEIEQSRAAVSGAISKITRVLPPGARERLESLSSLLFLTTRKNEYQPDAALLIRLSEAVQARQTAEIRYTADGRTTRRTVEPYGLVGRSGNWYLIAFCRLRQDFRTFRLDRIDVVEIRDEYFFRDEDFDYDAYVRDHVETYPGKLGYRVLFRADPETVKRKISSADGPFIESPDGVIFNGRTDSYGYEARYLVKLEIPFTVLDPPELRDALVALSDEVLASAGVQSAGVQESPVSGRGGAA